MTGLLVAAATWLFLMAGTYAAITLEHKDHP